MLRRPASDRSPASSCRIRSLRAACLACKSPLCACARDVLSPASPLAFAGSICDFCRALFALRPFPDSLRGGCEATETARDVGGNLSPVHRVQLHVPVVSQ
jgi:hypothetical protein